MKLTVSKRSGEAAHSLPEAVIAALIVGIMTVSLYAGFSTGFSMMRAGRDEMRAAQILSGRLEALRLYTWRELQDTNFVPVAFTECYDPSGVANSTAGAVYSGYITVKTPTASSPLGGASYKNEMLEVTVKLYWTNYAAGQPVVRSRQMQSYVARFGSQNYSL